MIISRRHAARRAKWLSIFSIRQGTEELQVRDSPESVSCVLEQDILFASEYCSNIGRQKIVPT